MKLKQKKFYPVRSRLRFATASSNGGFIALMSAVIISVVLLIAITTTGLAGFYGRFNIADSEYKERSSALADACFDTILIHLANDPTYNSYAVPETVSVTGTDNCQILTKSIVGNTGTFTIRGIYQHAYTNLQIAVDTGIFSVTSWQEVP